ncbi:GyrI-like domain-containing protein [Virgibacillus pantothenticus]|uniref:AraC family transcriptional regulator n=1 Tax=Virgibacillus pantothenticus TaxID=1473 RepID=UPI001C235438|nr:GyrI-like domain-containing protein [Virgibacillus pantothenticus]MBU8568627.1 GyrI-like domain-containing protein [Virgibacillus pantothenticus]MBU8602629.1 GyrI-like domain-containing protein [Virgibacillus pantothenticus]MBU8636750.1 GyrI-like domain-containing protein [Virgibacillus pantothenticus]MBU8644480.1 GyrI-like domain-containing protein [Virgibacillus pantothenticus]MBU8648569.1 GyrI-like domain-containing protein [Virgibacillus pantothenticus]
MKSKIEIIPSLRIAFMRRTGPYGPENVKVMERLKKWAAEKKLLLSATILAIPQDNPDITSPENCRFDACIVISDEYQIMDDSINERKLSGGKYVVYEIKHTAADIATAYTTIFPDLKVKGYQIENRPILERYTSDMFSNPHCEICVPIK